MKLNKKIFALGSCLLLLCGAISSVSAYTYLLGTKYQQATFVDIPGFGHAKYNLNYGSKKATTEKLGTFKKVKSEALLGNYTALVTKTKGQVSNEVGVSSTPRVAVEYGVSKGTIYFARVGSSSLEPSNTCDVTLKFSADNLKPH